MKRFHFKKGLVFIELNTRWQLIKRLVTHKLQFESELGEVINLMDKEVLVNWQTGKWQIDEKSLGIDSDAIYLVTPADLSTFPMAWQARAKRKLHYLNAVNPSALKFNVAVWRAEIANAALEINDNKPPSPSALYTWWRRYRETKSISALLPQVSDGHSKKEDIRFSVFEDVIQKVYLNAQKLPANEVVRHVKQRITLMNIGRTDDDRIKQVSAPTIYRWINNLRGDIRDSSRLGAEYARNKYRTVAGGLKVGQVFERVEMDHTPLDLIVIDKSTNLPLGRAWLTLAIDKFSRLVVGFYISFNAPSSYSVLQCIKMMILPKNKWLAKFSDLKNEWPVFGIPDLIALDNGMDLHSEAVKKACLELGIQILYCPAATPEMKGSVERFFRTINQDLIHKLPGSTFSNIDERGDYESEILATIDMATLTHLITKWIVDVYNVTPHRGIHDTPLNKWSESAKHRSLELPVYPDQLTIITGVPAKRTAFHYGVELEGIYYNNRHLQELRKRSGVNLQVDLKFYEEQVGFIDVFDPYAKEYLRIEAVHEDYSKDLHREAHRLARAQARKRFGDQYSMPQLMEARLEIEAIVKSALTAKKMGHRKQAANALMHDSNAVFNDESRLETIKKKPLKKASFIAPEPLDSGLDDELPALNMTHQKEKP